MDGCGPFATIFRVRPSPVGPLGRRDGTVLVHPCLAGIHDVSHTHPEPALRTLPVGITLMVGFRGYHVGPLMAGTVVVTLPVVAMFIYFQKYLITGMDDGRRKRLIRTCRTHQKGDADL